jgi:hypothetical protein
MRECEEIKIEVTVNSKEETLFLDFVQNLGLRLRKETDQY